MVYKNITGLKSDSSAALQTTISKENDGKSVDVKASATESSDSDGELTNYIIVPSSKNKKTIFSIFVFLIWILDESKNSDDTDTSDDKDGSKFKASARPRDESPESKKLRKKAVKDAKADKRKSKLKKHIKKRNTKKK